MKRIPEGGFRAQGFYWIRFEGAPIVAEYVKHDIRCAKSVPGMHWHVPGSPICYASSEVCELLTGKLQRPSA